MAAILVRHLAHWAITNQHIHPAQKGFLPLEGCAFVLKSVLEDCKRQASNAFVMWPDLKNAFGSVPHSAKWGMMRHLGVPIQLSAPRRKSSRRLEQPNHAHRTPTGYKTVLPVQPSPLPPSVGGCDQTGSQWEPRYAALHTRMTSALLAALFTDYMQSMVTHFERCKVRYPNRNRQLEREAS